MMKKWQTIGLALWMALCARPGAAVAGLAEGDAAFAKQDYAAALKQYQPLALQGNAAAQNSLGQMVYAGQGVEGDYQEAVRWFRLAADQGYAHAQTNLARRYFAAHGVREDLQQALYWYGMAADQGDASAQCDLGSMYEMGRGTPSNRVVAYALYNVSVATDPSDSNYALAARKSLAESMPPAEIQAAQALSRTMGQPHTVLKAIDKYLGTQRPLKKPAGP